MLLYRQSLLAACLLLPLLQPWKYPAAASPEDVSIAVTTVIRAAAPARHGPSLEQSAMFLLGAGMLVRFIWLAMGLSRLRRHRVGAERVTRLPRLLPRFAITSRRAPGDRFL